MLLIFQLNVPLNLPNRKRTADNLLNGYFDIPVPLCVHDSMLDVRVLSDARGFVAVCHYYLYQVSITHLNKYLKTKCFNLSYRRLRNKTL